MGYTFLKAIMGFLKNEILYLTKGSLLCFNIYEVILFTYILKKNSCI